MPQEKFQPYFADAGYDSWAVSLRGQGGSDPVQGASVAGETRGWGSVSYKWTRRGEVDEWRRRGGVQQQQQFTQAKTERGKGEEGGASFAS